MTTFGSPSLGSLRALAASRRRGFVAGSTWSNVVDRDLDRMAAELLVLSHSDAELLAASQDPAVRPITLKDRLPRSIMSTHRHGSTPHPRAS